MGGNEEWAEPNGLLPNAGPVVRVLDPERWSNAEERTAELITCIQPNPPSEERRNAVADYVQRLIAKCFPCQVFKFGSVPLKTYLPDGDIDLTAFSNNHNLKDTWPNQVRDMLENEEKNENAEFCVKEVQYIQAEVKIIKCLVENIVVDISFNQVGGLCTLCFLEEVDHMISQNHLFKRSIILIKAWCYYESRILGAHHGLISTYALETLVLYIFHVFNNSFAGPLEVLYRFLEFFSNFDWDTFCVSLWGPVPISSLPNVTAEPPRKDGGELLLSKPFLEACSFVYAVFPPGGQENQGQAFTSKYFNVIDPLRVSNNLGRSVSKGNFFRIRSAFAFGAKRLARLLDCPKEKLIEELNQFFMNTWDRHGSGCRPDVTSIDLPCWRLSAPVCFSESENFDIYSYGIMSQTSDFSVASNGQSQKSHAHISSPKVSGHNVRESNPNQHVLAAIGQRNLRSDHLVNDVHGRFLFARTRSSPELTDTYSLPSSQVKHGIAAEDAKVKASLTRFDNSNRRKNFGSETVESHGGHSLNDDSASVTHVSYNQNLDAATDSNGGSNSYHHESGLDGLNEELSSTAGSQGMQQEEQDLANMMASASLHGLNGQVHVPLNLASTHLPFPISPSFLESMGYNQRNMPGVFPANIPLIDPSFTTMQFPHGLVSPPFTHYFQGFGSSSTSEGPAEQNSDSFGPMEPGEVENEYWQGQDIGSAGGSDPHSGKYEMRKPDDKLQPNSSGYNFVAPSWVRQSGSSVLIPQRQTKYKHRRGREDHPENFQFQNNRETENNDERIASSDFSSAAHSNSVRSKTSAENSWDGLSTKSSKSTKEERGRKGFATEPAAAYGKGKIISEPVYSQAEDDDQEWGLVSDMAKEIAERSSGPESVSSLSGYHASTYEASQTSNSDSMKPIAPILMGPGSQQRMADSSGLVAFYPTGPPVPFLTMLPVYNVPPEGGISDASTCHFGGDEGLDNHDSARNLDSSKGLEQSEGLSTSNSLRAMATTETSDEHKSDILNSDFGSHWQNLQFGRFCQNPRSNGPLVYPSPVMVPPAYLQGRFPWAGPGRPFSVNSNLYSQLTGYRPCLVPVAPLHSVSSKAPNVYQHYVDDMPRYRSGTGTYLPNPVSVQERHSSGSRRGNYNSDRNDNRGDREGNWRGNSKSRAAERSLNRSQSEKSNSRLDRLSSSESRPDRSWSSYRHDLFTSDRSQNGFLHANSTNNGPTNVAYGMYPLQAMSTNGASSNGPTIPPVVMLYPFDHSGTFQQLEFGSLGPLGFRVINDHSQLSEGSQARGAFDEVRFCDGSAERSSPDQPSSPHNQKCSCNHSPCRHGSLAGARSEELGAVQVVVPLPSPCSTFPLLGAFPIVIWEGLVYWMGTMKWGFK